MIQWVKRAVFNIIALLVEDLKIWATTWISIVLIVLFALITSPFLSAGYWALANGIFILFTLIGVSFAVEFFPWGRKSSSSE